jgi:hypothetical protein
LVPFVALLTATEAAAPVPVLVLAAVNRERTVFDVCEVASVGALQVSPAVPANELELFHWSCPGLPPGDPPPPLPAAHVPAAVRNRLVELDQPVPRIPIRVALTALTFDRETRLPLALLVRIPAVEYRLPPSVKGPLAGVILLRPEMLVSGPSVVWRAPVERFTCTFAAGLTCAMQESGNPAARSAVRIHFMGILGDLDDREG